jgi:GxxExxY protein
VLIDDPRINGVTNQILSAAIDVHRTLGPGLLESIYASCLRFELSTRNLRFVAEQAIPIRYKECRLEGQYRVDLVVEDLVVVEVKSVDALARVHEAQVLTYLKLTGCRAGLLINFNVPRLLNGVRRLLHPRAITP